MTTREILRFNWLPTPERGRDTYTLACNQYRMTGVYMIERDRLDLERAMALAIDRLERGQCPAYPMPDGTTHIPLVRL